jgi:hypothetical protein
MGKAEYPENRNAGWKTPDTREMQSRELRPSKRDSFSSYLPSSRGDGDSLRTSVPDLQKAAHEVATSAKHAAANTTDPEEQDRKLKLDQLADAIPEAVREEAAAAVGKFLNFSEFSEVF